MFEVVMFDRLLVRKKLHGLHTDLIWHAGQYPRR